MKAMIAIADVIAYHEEQMAHWDKLYDETLPTTEAIEHQRDRFAARRNEHMRSVDHFRALAAQVTGAR